MKIVETKAYTFKLTNEERKQIRDIVGSIRDIAREIRSTIGDDYPIKVRGCNTYTSEDLWRAADLLERIACDSYEIC